MFVPNHYGNFTYLRWTCEPFAWSSQAHIVGFFCCILFENFQTHIMHVHKFPSCFATYLALHVFILLGMVSNWEGATNEYAMNMNEHYAMNGLLKWSKRECTYLFEKYKKKRKCLDEKAYKKRSKKIIWIGMEMPVNKYDIYI